MYTASADFSFDPEFSRARSGAMVEQLRGEGIAVEVDPEEYPNGFFASLKDPEGNPIQLWQPADRDSPV